MVNRIKLPHAVKTERIEDWGERGRYGENQSPMSNMRNLPPDDLVCFHWPQRSIRGNFRLSHYLLKTSHRSFKSIWFNLFLSHYCRRHEFVIQICIMKIQSHTGTETGEVMTETPCSTNSRRQCSWPNLHAHEEVDCLFTQRSQLYLFLCIIFWELKQYQMYPGNREREKTLFDLCRQVQWQKRMWVTFCVWAGDTEKPHVATTKRMQSGVKH